MTFSVPPNQNHHLMTSCMAHVRLGCAFPSFSLQHFCPGGGLCHRCERCHFVRRWRDRRPRLRWWREWIRRLCWHWVLQILWTATDWWGELWGVRDKRRPGSHTWNASLSKARMALEVRPSHGQTTVKSSSWGAGYKLCEPWSQTLSGSVKRVRGL